MSTLSYIKSLLANRSAQQVFALYASLFVGLIISMFVSSINTHALGASHFGDFKFLQNFSTFTIIFCTFGFFVSGGRLLAVTDDQIERRRMLGSVILLVFIIYLVFALLLWSFSYYFSDVFDRELGGLIRLALPLLFIYPLNICLENVLKGLNAIYSLATIRLLPNLLYLVYAYLLSSHQKLDLTRAYFGYLGFSALVFLIVLLLHKPLFQNIPQNIRRLFQETKYFGFKVYTGILASLATMQFGGIMVAYFLDTTSAGFFLLAKTITIPLAQISATIGITFFKKFATQKYITPSVMLATIGAAGLLLVAFFIIVGDIVVWLYPPEFVRIIPLCYIMATGATLQGIGGVINNFICARGHGSYSRNAAFIRGGVTIVGYTVGIKYFGLTGAAFTVLISGAVYFVAMIAYYKVIVQGEK